MIYKFNHFILFIFLSFWTTMLWAQSPKKSWILNTDESAATKNYLARESIALQSNGTTGFHFKAEAGKTFSAKIDVGLLFPPSINSYATADGTITKDSTLGASVGNIPGKFSVSPSGASTYTVSIECPSGINGMQPQISIVYNSQLPSGLLGRGFDLACSSTITRVPHSLYYDNDTHSVTFDGNDRFALDGMRLISDDNSTYNSTGTIYFTENNQTARITSIGTTGDGPESFKVETPDGKTMEYGSTTDSRLIPSSETGVYIWYLKKVTDRNGNSIEYVYTKFYSETVLSSIQYSGGSIEFSYLTSPNKNNYYTNGNEIKNGTFLERIRVKGLNDYIRNYEFNGISQNGQVLLTEIKEYYNKKGSDYSEIDSGEEDYLFIKPIKFYWTNYATSTFNNNLLGGTTLASSPAFIDFNGDGYDDVYTVTKTGTDAIGQDIYTQKIRKNEGNSTSEILNQNVATFDQLRNSFKIINSSINSFADIDGDGKIDLIYKIKSVTNSGMRYDYNINFKTFSGLSKSISIVYHNYSDPLYYIQDLTNKNSVLYREFKEIYGDFDGDGNTEMLVIQDDNNCWLVKYINGTLTKTTITTNGVNLYSITDIPTGDFDGDGKMDFGFNVGSTFKTYKIQNNSIVEIYTFNNNALYVADINQDGTTDIITFYNGIGEYDSVLQGNISTLNYAIYFREKNNTFKAVSGELLRGDVFSKYVHENFPTFTGVANKLTTTETIAVRDVRFEDTDGDGLLNIVLLYDRMLDFEKYHFNDGPSEYITTESKTVISSFLDSEDFFTYTNRNLTNYSFHMNVTGNIAVGSYCGNAFVMNPMDYYTYLNKSNTESRYQYDHIITANINGNGNRTYCMSGTYENLNGVKVFNYVSNYQDFQSNRYSIKSIEDAYGNFTTIDYKIPEQAGTEQAFPYFTYKTGSPVVNTVKQSNTSLNYSRTSTYSFTNEVFHRYKGFLGYLNTSLTDPDGITQTTTGVLNSTYGLIIPKWENSIVKSTTTDVTVIDKLNKRYWIRPDKVTEINYLNTGESNLLKTTKSFENYDSNGNPTSIKTEYGDGTGVSSTETLTYFPASIGSWYANKPATYSRLKKSPNVPDETRTKEYIYYDNGNIKTEISDKDNVDNLQLTNEYVYDSFGNTTQVSVTTKDLTTGTPVVRTSTMTYPTGRFIETKTDPLGKKITYHWNAENGLLISEDSKLSVNSPVRSTSYSYDIWGRLIETIYPDGIRKVQMLQWAEPNNTLKAKYYVYSQTSGSAPVQVWYDALGREVSKESYGLNDKKVSVYTEYNADGRVKLVSEPTFNSSAEVWAQYDFDYSTDPFKRVTSVKTPTGTVTNTYGKTSSTTLSVSTPEGTKTTTQETTLNNAGQKVSSKVDGKEVTYTYYASGLPKTSIPSGGQALTMVYNVQGKRISLIDPDAGTVVSKYNGFGELVEEKQKVHNNTSDIITTNAYKLNGLLDYIVRNGETTSYTYDTENRVSKIEISSTNKQEFSYDGFGHVTNVIETVGTKTFERKTEYDFFNRVKKEIYPTGYYTLNKYDEYGNLSEITDNAGRSIWKALDENARRQLTSINKGGKVTTFGFDAVTGLPTSTFASGVINYSYMFNNLGNLIERNDNNTTQKEKFVYNTQNQLTDWDVYQNITTLVKHNFITYNSTTGNIIQKSDLGAFTLKYGGEKEDGTGVSSGDKVGIANGALIGPHALTSISGVPANFPTADLNVTYTDFKKIATLSEGSKYYTLTYGVDDQRRMSEYKVGGVIQLTRYYVGDYEEEIDKDNKVRKIHYLRGAILIQETNQPDKFYYTYADYQGSLLALTDESGAVVQNGRFAYDPWGARRDPDNWAQKDSRISWIVNRGYTGHEHLDAFGIINMNGRVYDPYTAMFFSPDPALNGSNWLSYNRYGYCMGNPFKYTDPSGNNPALLAAAFIGGFINFGIQMFSGHVNSFGDALMAFGVGALAGLTGAWVGGLVGGSVGVATSLGEAISSGGTIGAAAGATSGFVNGVGNAWMSGASFGAVLKAGLMGAGTGFIIGGGLGSFAGEYNFIHHPQAIGGDLAYIKNHDITTGSTKIQLTGFPEIDNPNFNINNYGVWSDGGTAFESFTTSIEMHLPRFNVPIYEINPGLNGVPIEFAAILAAEMLPALFESGAAVETEYAYTNSAGKHLTEMIQHGENAGQLVRPYMKSPLTIEEIMSTGEGTADATFEGGMNWQVSGAFRGSQGTWELGLNPESRIIYHFNFVSF